MEVRKSSREVLPRHVAHWLLHGELDPDRRDGFGAGALACFQNGSDDWRRLWNLHGAALKREHPGRLWGERLDEKEEHA